MKTTAPPTIRNSRMKPRVAMRRRMLMKRADDWRAECSGRCGGLATGALPAAEAGEDVGQARQGVVGRRLLLVVDHQQPLGLEPEPGGDVPDRVLDVLRRGVLAAVVGVLRLLGEDPGRGAAGARVRLGRGAGAARADH